MCSGHICTTARSTFKTKVRKQPWILPGINYRNTNITNSISMNMQSTYSYLSISFYISIIVDWGSELNNYFIVQANIQSKTEKTSKRPGNPGSDHTRHVETSTYSGVITSFTTGCLTFLIDKRQSLGVHVTQDNMNDLLT